jgi:DNA polymerase (family 10)
VNSGARDPAGLQRLRYGIMQARRGWLEAADVLNTQSLAAVRRLLRRTMG